MKDKVCIVTTIKAPLKDTLDFVNYHLNIGIDHIFFLFDDPNDTAIKVLKNNNNLTCFKCNEQHWEKITSDPKLKPLLSKLKNSFVGESLINLATKKTPEKLARVEKQELNAKYVLNIAKKEGYDWIIHMDSDELVYIEGSLKRLLYEMPKDIDAIRLTTLEAVPEKHDPKNIFREVNLFKSMEKISRFYYSNKKFLQKVVPFLKRHEGNISGAYFKGHAAGKSIVRISSRIERVGIHEPVPKEGYKLIYNFPSNGYLLHFDCCSFEEWRLKCLRKYDGTVKAIAMKKQGKKVLEQFINVYKTGDEKELCNLYEKQYFMSREQKVILKSFGLLRKIKLDEKLFQAKPSKRILSLAKIKQLNTKYSKLTAEERIKELYKDFSKDEILFTSSFSESSAILLFLLSKINQKQKIYFIDTGYHFKETLEYKEKLTKLWGLYIENINSEKNKHDFTESYKVWKENPNICCLVNKVEPLNEIKKNYTVWISGLMKWQSDHRKTLDIFEMRGGISKFHPLLDITEEERKEYFKSNNLPTHPLEKKGYSSIGCKHCTMPGKGREGRWNNNIKTECGLHL